MARPVVCIFCGSSMGSDPIYAHSATDVSSRLALLGFDLVYGGAAIGIMGVVANAFLKFGAKVTGVIPEFLALREIKHTSISELIVTQSMHERKAAMAERASAFIALPGGYGTLEELLEVITWNQIRVMDRPVIIYNINGYFDPLIEMLAKAELNHFVRKHEKPYFTVATSVSDIVQQLEPIVLTS